MSHIPSGKSRPGLAGLVLAAGGGTRFGGLKQLALYRGRTLIANAASRALGVCDAGVFVVTGAKGSEVARAVAGLPVATTHNPAWQSGISTSIAAGISAIPATASALLVMLCDQPLVDEADLAALAEAARDFPQRVVAARYGDRPAGVPAIFPRSIWRAFQALRGDAGARALISTLDPVAIEMPHAAIDIDVPADLDALSDK
jgi:molybdenum cofactor cytidylyltransferase